VGSLLQRRVGGDALATVKERGREYRLGFIAAPIRVAPQAVMYYHWSGGNTMATTVNTKGQVTIPEPLRSKYGFPPGTKVV
jgi:hypothetical protein